MLFMMYDFANSGEADAGQQRDDIQDDLRSHIIIIMQMQDDGDAADSSHSNNGIL